MRTIHYSIRLALMLIAVALFYSGVTTLFRQAVKLPVLLTLLFITFCTERLWVLLAWLSPIFGTMDTQEQQRLVEYELARSQRYNSLLVVAVIREKKRIPLRAVAQNLRTTDLVLRSSAGYLLVLLPGITLEQATPPLKRLTMILPIKDVVVADEKMLQDTVKAKADLDGQTRNVSSPEFRKICMQALAAKSASIRSSENEAADPVIYPLVNLPQSEELSDRKILL